MQFGDVSERGLVILGCGKMGSALLSGWLKGGLAPGAVWVLEPRPSAWLEGLKNDGLHLNADLPEAPALALVAVKPQMIGAALPRLAGVGGGATLVLSIAAGTPLAALEAVLGGTTSIVRAMPNTPAAVGHGITAIIGNARVSEAHLELAEALLAAVGQVVRLPREAQMDAVTALSGSGPAYVFYLIEAMAAAGEAEGLAPDLALHLARATVAGAGALAEKAAETPGQLRRNVTSPGGTTAAALKVLMDAESGLPALMCRAVHAAAERSRELAR